MEKIHLRGLLFCCGLMFLISRVSAISPQEQLRYMALLQASCKRVGNPVLSYRYKISLSENGSIAATDSISGILYKDHDNYLDSNIHALTIVNGGYFFKADRRRKAAVVCNITRVQQQLGLKPEDMNNNLVTIPDSLFSKIGELRADERNDMLVLTYTFKKPGGSLKELVFRINKKDNAILDIRIVLDDLDKWGSSSGYTRTCYLTGFSNEVDPARFDLKAYLDIVRDKATLRSRYKSYTLNAFL